MKNIPLILTDTKPIVSAILINYCKMIPWLSELYLHDDDLADSSHCVCSPLPIDLA